MTDQSEYRPGSRYEQNNEQAMRVLFFWACLTFLLLAGGSFICQVSLGASINKEISSQADQFVWSTKACLVAALVIGVTGLWVMLLNTLGSLWSRLFKSE